MSFILLFASKPDFPLKYAASNPLNASFLSMGRFVQNSPEGPIVYEDSENSSIPFDQLLEYDVLRSVGAGVLISKKLQNVLENHFPNEVQMLQAVFTYKGKICDEYKVMNVYNYIECYDLEKSIYKIHPVDQSYIFEKIVLKEVLEEYGVVYNIVRSTHDSKIVVSNGFKKLITSEKISGMKFSK